MYSDQNNKYNNGGNYSSSYQNYSYNDDQSYSNNNSYSGNYYSGSNRDDYRKPKKKNGIGRKIAVALLIGAVLGVSATAFFTISNYVVSGKVTEVAVAPEAEEEIAEEEKRVSESGIDTTQTVTAVVTDVTNVVEEVMPSVVSITNTAIVTQHGFWGQQYQTEIPSSGSGIIVGENETELLIVTNNHVIEDSSELKVQFIDGTVVDAKVKGTDVNMDLAVIAVDMDALDSTVISNISIAVLGDSDALKVGEPAIAIGNALGYGQSVTTGVISALNRQIEMSDGGITGTLIQTDAAINPGNSGGALLNVRGEVVGINSNKMGGSAVEGMGYAIPISSAKPIIEDLMNRETKDKVDETRKGYLGISGLDVTSDVSMMYGMPEGVYVAQVYDGGAQDAGMLKGDVITGFDGSSVKTMQDLQGYLEYYEIGETVLVTIQRPNAGGYIEQTLLVTLGQQAAVQE